MKMRSFGGRLKKVTARFVSLSRENGTRTCMRGRQIVFLDTSVWIAAVLSDRGASRFVLERALMNEFLVVSSPDVYEEAVRNIAKKYPHFLEEFTHMFTLIHPTLVQPHKPTLLRAATIIHPDDAPILAAAMDSGATIVLTLDRKHFLLPEHIEKESGIAVMLPGVFVQEFLR